MMQDKGAHDRKIELDTFVMLGNGTADESSDAGLRRLLRPQASDAARRRVASETDVYNDGGRYVAGIKEEIGRSYLASEAEPVRSNAGVMAFLFNKIEDIYSLNYEDFAGYLEGTLWELLYGSACRYATLDWLESTVASLSVGPDASGVENVNENSSKVLLVSKYFLVDRWIYNGSPKAGIRGVSVNVLNADYNSLLQLVNDLSCMARTEDFVAGGTVWKEAKRVQRQMRAGGFLSQDGSVLWEKMDGARAEMGEYVYADIMDRFPRMMKKLERLENAEFLAGHYSEHFAEIHAGLLP